MYQVYEIMDGDSLDSISNRFNVSDDEIFRLNGINSFDFLSGDMIVVPKNNDLYFKYIVKSGDTMYGISNMFNQDVDVLYQINGIEGGDYIYPGEELLIPNSNTSFYLTKDGDTISDVFNYFNISNDNYSFINDVLLVGDQLIVYKRD